MAQSAEQTLAQIYDVLNSHVTEAGWDDPQNLVFKYLRHDGAGDQTAMNADGDPTPVVFEYVVPDDRIFYIVRTLWAAIAAAAEDLDGFFGLVALTNGLLIQILKADDSVVENFETDAVPIKTHTDMGALAGTDVGSTSVSAANRSRYGIRWTLARAGRAMRLTQGQKIRITVRDDLSALISFRVMVQGWSEKAA